jgi:dienelactone hydrolase
VPSARAVSSLPAVPTGARPGPDILYAPPAVAPQLENAGIWHARPILVSGAQAYRDGEYLYQGFLFDDHGAAGMPDPANAGTNANFLFGPSAGTLSYPTGPSYDDNAADLVEFRVKPLADATAFRLTLNTLADPSLVGFTVAIGNSRLPVSWPYGAGVSSPARYFLTVHGTTGVLSDAATGAAITPAPRVSVDLRRRQFQVLVPHAVWNPRQSTVRMSAGVGLWDRPADSYLRPGASATATAPGGAAPDREAIFDLAFRFHEPISNANLDGLTWTLGDTAAMEAVNDAWWREKAQAAALRLGVVAKFHAEVDFAKLQHRVTDNSGVPRTGFIDRIFASHFSFGQGIDTGKLCGRFPTTCEGMIQGQLQPYALYVPPRSAPAGGWGLTVLLHAWTANYNEFQGTRYATQLGQRVPGSLVLTPESRGPDGDYTDYTESDAFEAWADVARHYHLDPSLTDISGFSMGGGGTYKLSERWPDLFARAMATAAAPFDGGFQSQWMAPLRNVPVMTWIGQWDEGAASQGDLLTNEQQEQAMGAAGLRFIYDIFPGADHTTVWTNDQYAPVAAFFGEARVDLNPPHVSYVVDPSSDFPAAEDVGNHAYWVSDLTLRDPTKPAHVDALSLGFGKGDPTPSGNQSSQGVLSGGHHGPMPYLQDQQSWVEAPQIPASDQLQITASNLSSITIDATRARLDCNATLDVKTDGPVQITLADCLDGASKTTTYG